MTKYFWRISRFSRSQGYPAPGVLWSKGADLGGIKPPMNAFCLGEEPRIGQGCEEPQLLNPVQELHLFWVANKDLVELELRTYLNLWTYNLFEMLKYHEWNNLEISKQKKIAAFWENPEKLVKIQQQFSKFWQNLAENEPKEVRQFELSGI